MLKRRSARWHRRAISSGSSSSSLHLTTPELIQPCSRAITSASFQQHGFAYAAEAVEHKTARELASGKALKRDPKVVELDVTAR